MHPWVARILRVLYYTTPFMVRYGPVPTTGTVFVGTGAVSKNPTHGIPVRYLKYGQKQEQVSMEVGDKGMHTQMAISD